MSKLLQTLIEVKQEKNLDLNIYEKLQSKKIELEKIIESADSNDLNEGFFTNILSQFDSFINSIQVPKGLESKIIDLKDEIKIAVSNNLFDYNLYYSRLGQVIGDEWAASELERIVHKNKITHFDFFTEVIFKLFEGLEFGITFKDNRFNNSLFFKNGEYNLKTILSENASKKLSSTGVKIIDTIIKDYINIYSKGIGRGEAPLMIFFKQGKSGSDIDFGNKKLEVKSGKAIIGNIFPTPNDKALTAMKRDKEFGDMVKKIAKEIDIEDVPAIFNVNGNLARHILKAEQLMNENDFKKYIDKVADVYVSVFSRLNKNKVIKFLNKSNPDYKGFAIYIAEEVLKEYKSKEGFDSILFYSKHGKEVNGDFVVLTDSNFTKFDFGNPSNSSMTFSSKAGQAAYSIKLGYKFKK